MGEVHARLWEVMQTGRFTQCLLPKPDLNLTKSLLSFSRLDVKSIIRMLTQHNGLRDHLFRIGRVDDPICSKCGEGPETPLHVFESCPALMALKQQVFGSHSLTLCEALSSRPWLTVDYRSDATALHSYSFYFTQGLGNGSIDLSIWFQDQPLIKKKKEKNI